MKRIEAVVFDMDGVLFDTENISIACWKDIAGGHGLANVEEVAVECIGRNRADICAVMRSAYGEDFAAEEFLDETAKRAQEKVERDGLPVMKGVKELLDYLKQNGYKIGLASSTRKVRILDHLKRAGLTEYFEMIIGGDMVEHSKPEPDIYRKACELLGVSPDNAMALEDSPNGIRSAAAAGMKAVMIPDYVAPTPEMEAIFYAKCDSLLDVIDLLQA